MIHQYLPTPYAPPTNATNAHPDLTYTPPPDALQHILKRANPAPNLKFWTHSHLLQARNWFKHYQRSPPNLSDHQLLELFIIDVVDPIAPPDHLPPTFTQIQHLRQPFPLIQIFGVSLHDESSICLRLWGFFPYLLAECPAGLEKDVNACGKLQKYLENNLSSVKDVQKKIISVELVEGESLMEFVPDRPKHFFKIGVALVRLVSTVRSCIESGIRIDSYSLSTQPYEANIAFPLRWMIDANIVGCGCLRVKSSALLDVQPQHRSTRCQRELDVFWSEIEAIPCTGKYAQIPQGLRILSLDIECVTIAVSGFPVPEKDPIIQISSILTNAGAEEPLVKVVFTLDTCQPIAGASVISFADERAMLSLWREMVVYFDPDILVGYNFINFDLNYLVVRSQVLDVPNFRNLGRIINTETKISTATLSTRALGTHETKNINIEGRIQFDALEFIRREYKLKSYSLNGVSAHFLKEQKEDVHYSQIGDLQKGSAETRRRIATYCLKDSYLVLKLLDKLAILINYIEMARVTGVPLPLLLTRGQQIKVTSQLVRKCREMKHFMPSIRVQGGAGEREVAYEGATVLEPLRDFYDVPIGTLDFASLYPSIMIAHNLCYTTLTTEEHVVKYKLKEEDIHRTPANKIFVRAHIKRGILPTVVADLLAARKLVKKELKEATDPLMRIVLDGRQLAIKISANSVYGYTGAAATGQLPCLAISESITAYGRSMIDFTKSQVESRYRKENGYEHDAVVVYGDTDSVMVKFGTIDVAEAMRLGREAAVFVSDQFTKPIALEFEKVYFPFLLMNKKRYAGLMWTEPSKYAKIDCKGIETVRRDFCLLVQTMVDDALKALLIRRDVEGARKMTKARIQDLLLNKIDMSYLVLSKSLGKDDYAAKLAHVELAKKLRKRDPATAPQIGDRVYYVIVAGTKGQAQYERAEDPLYALENNVPIDVDFYLDSIKNPLTRIFEPIEKSNVDSLFCGAHTRQRKLVTSTAGALSKFVTTGLRCLGCRGVVKSGAFCVHCKSTKERQVVLEKMEELAEKEKEFHALWVECQRCQESLHQDVICTSRDCPIFYRRMKVKKEIDHLHKSAIARITTDSWIV